MADLPIDLPEGIAERLTGALDVEGKIPRALEALGPIGRRDVGLVDVPDGLHTRRFAELRARLVHLPLADPFHLPAADGSLDAIIGLWSSFRGVDPATLDEVDRVLRTEGRLLVVHDYGRDDVSRLRAADLPEYVTWGRREGPFLRGGGFKIRVVHCFWTFGDQAELEAFLGDAFGEAGTALAATLKRPRLSWNVAVYHRWRGGSPPGTDARLPAVQPAGDSAGRPIGSSTDPRPREIVSA